MARPREHRAAYRAPRGADRASMTDDAWARRPASRGLQDAWWRVCRRSCTSTGRTSRPPTSTRARRSSGSSGSRSPNGATTPSCGARSSIQTIASAPWRPIDSRTRRRARISTSIGSARRTAGRCGSATRPWPVLADDGTVLFWRGVMLDITERKEAENKLRWSLEVLRRTLQQRRELAQRLQIRAGGGTPTHRRGHPRRPDPGDERGGHAAADAPGIPRLDHRPRRSAEIEREVATAIERLRSLLFELRPSSLDRDGLAAALRIYLEHTAGHRLGGRGPRPAGRVARAGHGGAAVPHRPGGDRATHASTRRRRRFGSRSATPPTG